MDDQTVISQIVLADIVSWLHGHRISIVRYGTQYKVLAPTRALELLGVIDLHHRGFVLVNTIGEALKRAVEFGNALE